MTFDQLRYFLAIVECKSFSRAADNIYISQSSLSKQIKSLENELKKQLFTRDGSQIELTESAKLFLEFAKRVTKEYQDLLEHLSHDNAGRIHTIRLGVLPLLLEYKFMDIITHFQMQYEHIKLMLSEDNQFELIKMLDNHQLDAIIARSDFTPMHKYEITSIHRDALCVACSERHHLAQAEIISLKEIRNESLAILEAKSSIYHLLYNACLEEGFTPNIVFSSNRHGHLLSMLAKNTNVLSVLPRNLVTQNLNPEVKIIPLSNHIYTTTSLIRRKEVKKNPYLDKFFEWWNDEMKVK